VLRTATAPPSIGPRRLWLAEVGHHSTCSACAPARHSRRAAALAQHGLTGHVATCHGMRAGRGHVLYSIGKGLLAKGRKGRSWPRLHWAGPVTARAPGSGMRARAAVLGVWLASCLLQDASARSGHKGKLAKSKRAPPPAAGLHAGARWASAPEGLWTGTRQVLSAAGLELTHSEGVPAPPASGRESQPPSGPPLRTQSSLKPTENLLGTLNLVPGAFGSA
jgi:hypothetical protein